MKIVVRIADVYVTIGVMRALMPWYRHPVERGRLEWRLLRVRMRCWFDETRGVYDTDLPAAE